VEGTSALLFSNPVTIEIGDAAQTSIAPTETSSARKLPAESPPPPKAPPTTAAEKDGKSPQSQHVITPEGEGLPPGKASVTRASQSPSEPDIEFIKASLRTADSRVRTLQITGKYFLSLDSFDVDVSTRSPNGVVSHAASGSDSSWKVQQFLNGEKITDDIATWDGSVTKTLNPEQKTGSIVSGKRPFVKWNQITVPTRLPVWDEALVERLQMDELELSSSREEVGGASCYVLTGRAHEAPDALKYRLFLDPSVGFLPRQMEEIRTVEPKELTRRVRLTQFEEIKPGVWVARRIEEEGHQGDVIFTRNVYAISSLLVNAPIPQEAFKLEFPQGTKVHDFIASKTYVVK
jgi:hypothetical protein